LRDLRSPPSSNGAQERKRPGLGSSEGGCRRGQTGLKAGTDQAARMMVSDGISRIYEGRRRALVWLRDENQAGTESG